MYTGSKSFISAMPSTRRSGTGGHRVQIPNVQIPNVASLYVDPGRESGKRRAGSQVRPGLLFVDARVKHGRARDRIGKALVALSKLD